MSERESLPVSGYTKQSDEKIAAVNHNKGLEEQVLRTLDELAKVDEVDKRWLAIGRTHIEEAFMAINRSIFRPQRIKLDPTE